MQITFVMLLLPDHEGIKTCHVCLLQSPSAFSCSIKLRKSKVATWGNSLAHMRHATSSVSTQYAVHSVSYRLDLIQ